MERIFHGADGRVGVSRADDCLTWSASLARGRKFYLNEPLVNYRIHANNCFAGRKVNSNADKYKRGLLVHSFFAHSSKNFPEYSAIEGNNLLRILLLEVISGNKNNKLIRSYGKTIYRSKKISLRKRIYYGYGLRVFNKIFIR